MSGFQDIFYYLENFSFGEISMRRKDKSLTELGSVIRKKRMAKKLRQADLEDFGINFKHYQDVECGRINPTYLTLLKIAKALECSARDFFPK